MKFLQSASFLLSLLVIFQPFSSGSDIQLCESLLPRGCSQGTKNGNGYFILLADEGSWPKAGFCRVIGLQSSDQTNYEVSVELLNFNSNSGSGKGHPGIMYNAKDENNYDFVYFRPYSVSKCYQTGYVKDGVIKWDGAKTGKCLSGNPSGGTWFKSSVKVEEKTARIYLNGKIVVKVDTKLPNLGKAGVLVANGYENTVFYKNLRVSASRPSLPGFTVSRCLDEEFKNGYHVLDARQGSWPADGFCQAVSDWSGGVSEYDVKVKLYNVIGWKGVNSGHLGVMYNVQNLHQDYDFVYFRPHSASSCFQTGYMSNGVPKFDGGKSSTCPGGPPIGHKWIDVKVSVKFDKVHIYLDNKHVVTVTPRLKHTRVAGVIVANGYKNVVHFKEFTLVSQ